MTFRLVERRLLLRPLQLGHRRRDLDDQFVQHAGVCRRQLRDHGLRFLRHAGSEQRQGLQPDLLYTAGQWLAQAYVQYATTPATPRRSGSARTPPARASGSSSTTPSRTPMEPVSPFENISSSGGRRTAPRTFSTALLAHGLVLHVRADLRVGSSSPRRGLVRLGLVRCGRVRLRQGGSGCVADFATADRRTPATPQPYKAVQPTGPAPLPGRGLAPARALFFRVIWGNSWFIEPHTAAITRPHPRCQRLHRQLPHARPSWRRRTAGLAWTSATTSWATASEHRFKFVEGDIAISREWIEYHVKKCDAVLPLVAIYQTRCEYVKDPLRVFELDFEANLEIVRKCASTGSRSSSRPRRVYGCPDAEL